MKISELIAVLEEIKEEHGDLPVFSYDNQEQLGEAMCDIELNLDGQPYVLV